MVRERKWVRDLLGSYSPQLAERLAAKFASNQTWQVPTFPVLVHLANLTPQTDLGGDPRLEYVPRKLREVWEEGRRGQLEHRGAEDFAERTLAIQRLLQIVGAMHAAGVPFLAGTDAAAPNVFPGSALHEDLVYLVQAGLTPLQALQAATTKPAEFLNRSPLQGSVETGKRADLVLLDANPLDAIQNTQKIRAVISNGRLLERTELDRLLAKVEQYAESH